MAFSFFRKSPAAQKPASGPAYRELVIREVIRETPDAIRVVFERPSEDFVYQSGQFITLILDISGKEERRSYSLCSSPLTDEHPAIGIKKVAGGKVSGWCVDRFRPGDRVRIMDPMGQFTVAWDAGRSRHLALIAGGSGITPMLSLLRTMLEAEPSGRVTLLYANRREESIMFRSMLDEVLRAFPERFKIMHVLDEPSGGTAALPGPISSDTIGHMYSAWGNSGWPAADSYMLCGPQPMMDAVTVLLKDCGVPEEAIRRESFTASAAAKPAQQASADVPHDVTVRYDGQEYRFTVKPGKTILETALDEGIDLPYSCRSGMCTACRGKAISGQVRLDEEDGLSKAEREEGFVLTCVGHPLTGDVVIEIG